MKKNTITLSAGILGLLLAGGISTAYANYDGNVPTEEVRAEVEAHKDAIETALENNDYDAWSQEMTAAAENRYNRALENITEDAFNDMKTRYDNGELIGEHRGKHRGMGPHGENFEDIKAAIEDDDFAAWSDIVAAGPQGEDFATEENFDKAKKIHELMESGDKKAAREMMNELRNN